MWVKAKKGTVIMQYEVIYENNDTQVIGMKNKVDIADWYRSQDHKNGQVVFRDGNVGGIYLTEWINPYPKQIIAGIKVKSTGNAIPIVIAVSGKKKFVDVINITE